MQTSVLLFREVYSHLIQRSGFLMIVIAMLAVPVGTWAFDTSTTAISNLQQITVTGTITDEQGDPLPGVNVVVQGTIVGVVSNVDGKFTINVPDEGAVLIFSFVGFTTLEIPVGNRRDLNVTMTEDSQRIEEVVVTGYGTQRKATLTGSISTVSNKELTVTKNENVVNMLAGKMPGIRISQRTSQPGQYNTKIDVRGYGEPFFVIDGIPRDKDYFSRMDPEEIESISLLKDASAAIYGLHASNGVMLITTKRGVNQGGKVDVTYSGNIAFQQMLFIPNGYTQLEWMTLRNEQRYKDLNSNNFWGVGSPVHSDSELEAAANAKEYNWQEKVFRKFTPQTQHNLRVNGGNEQLQYFVSLGYQRQDGCYSSGSLWADRWNFRTNVDAKITKRLSTSVSFGAILGSLHEPNGGLWDVYKAAWLQIPGTPYYANDNPEYLNGYSQYNAEFDNILGKTDHRYVGYLDKQERRLNGTFTLNYEIPGVKGLKARASYDYYLDTPIEKRYKRTYDTFRYDSTTDTYEKWNVVNGPMNLTSRRSDVTRRTNMQLGLSYANTFGLHTVGGTGVYEENYAEWENFTAQRYLALNSEYLFAGEVLDQVGSGGRPGDRSERAFIGKFNYDFAGKYMADFLFRYEATSRWPKGSRWGFFPGVMAGWRISEENFIKNNFDFVSNIKIRGSWGQMGDQNTNSLEYPQTFVGYESSNKRGWIFEEGNPIQGVGPTAIPNPNLTWMVVTMQNIALDFGFLNNKISGAFELFRRDRDGILANSSAVTPGTVGAELPQENINSDRNQGWELELTHRNRIGNIEYFATGQISHTRRSWVYRLEEPASHSFDHWRHRYSGRYHDDDFWWGHESGGMFSSIEDIRNFDQYPMGQGTLPGDWWRVDWNGDGVINDQDHHPIATKGLPYFNYGFALGGSYSAPFGTFDIQANFQGAAKVYIQLSEIFVEPLPFGGQNSMNWFLDRWHPADPNADLWHPDTQWISGYYPITGNNGRREGTNEVMNASYLRMKTLEIGYTLPKNLLSKAKVKNLRVYLSGYNLLTFTPLRDIDPERPSSTERAGGSEGGSHNMYMYPNNKTYIIGASITF